MIVSHRHRFIFLKTRKTAGTSVEIALSEHCGPDDVVTPIIEEQQRRELGFCGAQHYVIPFTAYRPKDWARLVAHRRRLRYREHATAAMVRRHVGARVWDGYYKFAVERNPWDKVISAYYWQHRNTPEPWPTLDDWVLSDVAHVHGFAIYSLDGEVAVDRVLRYEDLAAELAEVWTHLGLPGTPTLPQAKGGARADRRPYSEVIGAAARQHIEREYAREIALMGYRF